MWEKVSLPISAGILALDGKEIYAIGEKGVVRINSNMKVSKFLPFNFVGEFTSEDGGLSVKKEPDEQNPPYMCELEKAFIHSGALQMFARCDHLRQLWTVTFDKNSSPARVIYFVYPQSLVNRDDVPRIVPYRPTGLIKLKRQVLIPTIVPNGVALMSPQNLDYGTLQVHWRSQGQAHWKDEIAEGAVHIDFIGDEGWMLLGKGRIMYSSDGGSNWEHRTTLLPKSGVVQLLYNLKFRNSQQGYIIGTDGLILMTLDGGKTWEEQKTDIKEDLVEIIVLNDDLMITKSIFGNFFLNKNLDSEWKQVEFPHIDYVGDMLLHDGRLLILDGKELFWVHLDVFIKSIFREQKDASFTQ